MNRPERLGWLDVTRVLCALMILAVHWLHAAYNVGAPIDIIIQYQYQNGGWAQFVHSLIIANGAPLLATWSSDVIGFFGVFGWEAVSALILISGFSLALSQGSAVLSRSDWYAWYGKRARRILVPFYLIALPVLALCALALLALPHLHAHAAAIIDAKLRSQFHTPMLGVLLSHTVLFDPWAFHGTADFFAPAWWFVPAILLAYVAYPFLRSASRYRRGLPLLAGAALVSMAAYAASAVHLIANENWYYIVLQELFNFSLGIVVAQAWLASGRAEIERVLFDPLTIAVAAIAFVAGNVANDITALRPIASILYGPSLVVLLVGVARLLEGHRAARVLTHFDSYDLYLVHQPFAFPVAFVVNAVVGAYAVFAGWFVFLAVVAVATLGLTAAQTAVFRRVAARDAARREPAVVAPVALHAQRAVKP